MPSRSLSPRPNLEQLKLQAKELRRLHADGKRSAALRTIAHHPKFKVRTPEQALAAPLTLSDAQMVLAREYGFSNWAALKQFVEIAALAAKFKPHPRFDEALAAMDYGDAERLRGVLLAEPELVKARTNLEPPFHYFTGATLLHHIAGNPDRGRLSGKLPPLPKNSAKIARILLDAGADVRAETLGPTGGTAMGLLITSKQASDADVAGPLIELLMQRGAKLDLRSPEALDASLANHAPRAAEKMIELGARPDVLAAAALGRMALLREFFDDAGQLKQRPRRHGKLMSARDAIGLALLYAYVRERREAVDFLIEKDGNWNMTGVNNGAALHRAAGSGDLNMVRRLVARGADIGDRNNPYNATPLSWADHCKQREVFDWMRAHCPIDLHDAVGFDLEEHAKARIEADPRCVHAKTDQWDIPHGTALHCAARNSREKMAQLLIDSGSDVNVIAGNGLTALDIALQKGATAVVALLEQRGGKRALDL